MPIALDNHRSRYAWIGPGDVNAFFGLMLDNVAVMLLAVSLLHGVYGFPVEFALRYMIPGTALGVLVGDLLFTASAFRLARRTGRNDITAMPLGLDTPSTFGMVFFVLGPAYLEAGGTKDPSADPTAAATVAWQIGICSLFWSGFFKLGCALGSGWIRRVVPRAGLLGSLAAIALVLISFSPFLEVARFPVAGFAALAVILAALVARIRLPGRVPGALGALAVGAVIYFAMRFAGVLGPDESSDLPAIWFPGEWREAWSLGWLERLGDSVKYLPVVIPFALSTVVGGIDCTESAAAVGDEYDTGQVIAVEAVATLVAAGCGGVIQTTPYIGHPAYKAMGGRAAYTLATALFIGGAGLVGYFSSLYSYIPRPAVFPILVFIGLEITAQSFFATPKKHYAAVALACVPAMAALVLQFTDQLVPLLTTPGAATADLDQLAGKSPHLAAQLQTLRILSAGFIITSLLWSSALASLIDRKLTTAACFTALAAVLTLFGVIHSPLPGSPLFVPWSLGELPQVTAGQTPYHLAAGYATMTAIFLAWGKWCPPAAIDDPLHHE